MDSVPDLTVNSGGRLISPAFPCIDTKPPSNLDLTWDSRLASFMADSVPIESDAELRKRERVLTGLKTMVLNWVKDTALAKGYAKDVAAAAGGKLFTSGSYRLGIHEPGADIDTVCVVPSICDRADFFSTLKELLVSHPDVTNFNSVETAAVPIMTFDWSEVNIDLLFAKLPMISVPDSINIDMDSVLAGVDTATEKSLNGPRVTNLIANLVSGNQQRYKSFLIVVRCVRKWAKARGLYSNKLGYLGGVNFNIMAAMCCQLYPTASPSSLLRKFFLVYSRWRWPDPVLLTRPHDAGLGQQVWSPFNASVNRQLMPIITPAYPAMNSSLAVSRQTLQILHEELTRANKMLEDMYADPASTSPENDDGHMWERLFEKTDFFINYGHYIALCVCAPTESDLLGWTGFIESRLRKLISDLMGKSLPLSKLQLWPKKSEGCFADKNAGLTTAQRRNSVTFFIGFNVDRLRMKGDQLNVEAQIQNFKSTELTRFQPAIPGCDLCTNYFTVKQLPPVLFEQYEGGKAEGMKLRRARRDADPKRQARKREEKLEAMKQLLADKEGEGGGAAAEAAGQYGDDMEEGGADQEETSLLENALDALGGGAGRTRAEAERERERLLNEGEYIEADDETRDAERLKDAGFDGEGTEVVVLKIGTPEWRVKRAVSPDEGEAGGAKKVRRLEIIMKTKFSHVVELDGDGNIVDKGDDNFRPERKFKGRMGGFEFKNGSRGVGYYKTGVAVQRPSNVL